MIIIIIIDETNGKVFYQICLCYKNKFLSCLCNDGLFDCVRSHVFCKESLGIIEGKDYKK